MFYWMQFPFLRINIFFILGIVTASFFSGWLVEAVVVYILCVVSFLSVHYLFKKSRNNFYYSLTGFLFLFVVFIFGYVHFSIYKENHKPDHKLYEKPDFYLAVVKDDSEEKGKNFRTVVEVVKVQSGGEWKNASGKILVYHPTSLENKPFAYGDLVLVKGNPNPVQGPSNPEEFDYRKYLQNQHIYLQQFLKSGDFRLVRKETAKDLAYFIKSLRKSAVKVLDENIKGSQEKGIALALILGDKNELDMEIKQAYAASGAMHVLAVSGLHVGMIYLVILKLFGWMRKLKRGNFLFALLALSLLWIYAGITGLPASVFRAVTMFSVIILSQINNRNTNIYNSLAIAATLLLVYNPLFLFSVGFQLSFLAVAGIIYLFPHLYHLINPDNYLIDKIWGLSCIAFAAQLATFPLSLYYFHQFPVYFFLSNLVVIPAAFLILSTGLGLLVFNFVSPLTSILSFLLEHIIWIVNQILFTLEFLPHHVINELYITSFQTLLLYIIILLTALFVYQKKFNGIISLFIAVLLFFIISVQKIIEHKLQHKIVFYHIHNHTAIDFILGNNVSSFHDHALFNDSSKIKYHIAPYRLGRGIVQNNFGINKVNKHEFTGVAYNKREEAEYLVWHGKKLIILNKPSEGNNVKPKQETDFLVIRNNSYQELEPLVEMYNFKMLIIDGSNSSWLASKLEDEASRLNINFHSTRSAGALVIDL